MAISDRDVPIVRRKVKPVDPTALAMQHTDTPRKEPKSRKSRPANLPIFPKELASVKPAVPAKVSAPVEKAEPAKASEPQEEPGAIPEEPQLEEEVQVEWEEQEARPVEPEKQEATPVEMEEQEAKHGAPVIIITPKKSPPPMPEQSDAEADTASAAMDLPSPPMAKPCPPIVIKPDVPTPPIIIPAEEDAQHFPSSSTPSPVESYHASPRSLELPRPSSPQEIAQLPASPKPAQEGQYHS